MAENRILDLGENLESVSSNIIVYRWGNWGPKKKSKWLAKYPTATLHLAFCCSNCIFLYPKSGNVVWQGWFSFFFMNSEKWEVVWSFIINLSIVPFPLYTSLGKLVCTRSLVRSSASSTGLFAVLIWLANSVACDTGAHWLLGSSPLFSLRTSAASSFQHPFLVPPSTGSQMSKLHRALS